MARFELASVEQLNLGLSAGAVAVSYAFVTPHFAGSLAAGAFLEAVNLGAIHRGAQRFFSGELMTNGWIGMLSVRFLILAFAIYVTMQAGAHPIALLLGLSLAMPATVIDAWRNRPPIIDPAELPVFLDDLEDDLEEEGAVVAAGATSVVPPGQVKQSDVEDADYSVWRGDMLAAMPSIRSSIDAVESPADQTDSELALDDSRGAARSDDSLNDALGAANPDQAPVDGVPSDRDERNR